VNAVDIRVQLDALQAKLVARLLHPRRHPWKVLMAAAITSAAPRHLGVALPFFSSAALPVRAARRAGRPALLPRHAEYLRAMRRMSPHRHTSPAAMKPWDVLLEPVLDNPNIRHPTSGLPLTSTSTPSLVRTLLAHQVDRLRDLRTAVSSLPLPSDLQLALDSLPPSWRAVVTHPVMPVADFYINAAGTMVSTSPLLQDPQCRFFAVLPDGRLSADPAPTPTLPSSPPAPMWQACCVAVVPRPVALMTLAERQFVQAQLRHGASREEVVTAMERYLVGPYASIPVSPLTWATGQHRPLTIYSVRLTALRARRLRAIQKVPGAAGGMPLLPKAWANATGDGGLVAVEQRWVDSLSEGTGAPVAVDAQGAGPSDPVAALAARRRRQYASDWQPAPWLRDTFCNAVPADLAALSEDDALDAAPHSSPPDTAAAVVEARRRLRPRRGGPALLSSPPPASGSAVPIPASPYPGDHLDPAVQPPVPERAHLRQVWERLLCRRLPRDARALAWRVLHASLYTNVFIAHVTRGSAAAACCASPSCAAAPAFETMQHLFLECPAVAPAAAWLLRLWAAVCSPASPPPPCTAAVLLADDQRVWRPSGGEHYEALWTATRLSWLAAVWALRCKQQADPQRHPLTSAAIVASTVARISQLIRRDYARIVGDARTLTAAPSDWFRGPSVPLLAREEFLARWGMGEVLCTLAPVNAAGQGGGLRIRLSSMHPVAL
jgi:hypothetical protein